MRYPSPTFLVNTDYFCSKLILNAYLLLFVGVYAIFSVGGSSPAIATSDPGVKAMISGLFGLPFVGKIRNNKTNLNNLTINLNNRYFQYNVLV